MPSRTAGATVTSGTAYQQYRPLMFAIAYRMLGSVSEAEDVLQDVFVKVWQRASQFDPIRGRPLAWLVSMARYRAIDLQRAVRPAVALSDVSLALEPLLQVDGAADASEVLGSGSLLLRCLEQLAAPQRRCLVLAYEEGLTHSEIARAVRCRSMAR